MRPLRARQDDKFAMLRKLPCYQELHSKLSKGRPVAEVADFIREQRKMLQDVPRDKLIALLKEYRATLNPADVLGGFAPEEVRDARAKVEEGINELDELGFLYTTQKERIQEERKIEQRIQKLIPGFGKEIGLAKDILEARAKLKMDLGLDQRHLGALEVGETIRLERMAERHSPQVQEAMRNPESRQRILSVATEVRALLAARKTIEAEGQALPDEATADNPLPTSEDVTDAGE